jgi:nicotinamide mononucleotide transporter
MSGIEIIAVIFSLVCVYLTTRQNIWCWPTGIIGVIAFFILFYQNNLYSEMSLQIVFLIQSLYGWYNWGKDKEELPVTKLKLGKFVKHIIYTTFISILIGIMLEAETNSSQPFLDSLTACFSLLANWYLTRKIFQSWVLWIVVDVLLTAMFIRQGLYLSAGLYFVFIALAYKGLLSWKRDLKTV